MTVVHPASIWVVVFGWSVTLLEATVDRIRFLEVVFGWIVTLPYLEDRL